MSSPAITNAAPKRQQETQERPLLALLAVDRLHQREVEQDGDTDRRQHAQDVLPEPSERRRP